ncbi:MAG: HAD family hydrolase [Proteobacteria bacterium]|nr:MAG: HAD family hydrolase [Pseudomonadota bacterium]
MCLVKFKAYVFDLDGTLIDSKIDFAGMRAELNCVDGDDVLSMIEAMAGAARLSALEIVHRHEQTAAQTSTLIEGAREFIEAARALKIPCAILTRNSRETALHCLDLHKIEVDLVVAREDSPPKPDPSGLLMIAKHFGVEPSSMLFVGDYIYDLRAGLNAGVPTALYLPLEADFDTTGSHFHFSSYAELQKRV